MRPSLVRTTACLPVSATGASTSPPTLAIHFSLPARSRATTSPFTVPTMTRSPSPAAPEESLRFASTRVTTRPSSSSRTVIVPSAAAAKTRPPSTLGENLESPDLPTEALQATLGVTVARISASGIGFFASSHEPAEVAAAAQRQGAGDGDGAAGGCHCAPPRASSLSSVKLRMGLLGSLLSMASL